MRIILFNFRKISHTNSRFGDNDIWSDSKRGFVFCSHFLNVKCILESVVLLLILGSRAVPSTQQCYMNMDLWSSWDCISGSQEYWKRLCIGFINRSRVWKVDGDPILSVGYVRFHLEYLKRSHELGYIQRVRPRYWKVLTSCYRKQRKKLWILLDKTNWTVLWVITVHLCYFREEWIGSCLSVCKSDSTVFAGFCSWYFGFVCAFDFWKFKFLGNLLVEVL